LDNAARHVPTDVVATITCSPKSGVDATLEAAQRLSGHGYPLVPHLAARMVRDRGHLDELLQECERQGIDDVFVPGGDAEEPAGEFTSSLELLQAMEERGHPFSRVGIAGYPEGHHIIDDATLYSELHRKQRFATYIVSQMCFAAEPIVDWVRRLRDEAIDLDIYFGIAGVLDRTKLAGIAMRLGIGPSTRFLMHNKAMMGQLMSLRPYTPTDLVAELERELAGEERVRGLHLYTFNQTEKTTSWRNGYLRQETSG
jgi:methylenetetrahydrofolate reductase (NADPH)